MRRVRSRGQACSRTVPVSVILLLFLETNDPPTSDAHEKERMQGMRGGGGQRCKGWIAIRAYYFLVNADVFGNLNRL